MLVFAWILWSIYTFSIICSIIMFVICIAKDEEINITLATVVGIAVYVFLNIYLFAR